MTHEHTDPSGNTEAFKAFVQSPEPDAKARPYRLFIGLGVAAAVLLVLAVLLVTA